MSADLESSKSSPVASSTAVAVVRLTGGLYLIEVDEPFERTEDCTPARSTAHRRKQRWTRRRTEAAGSRCYRKVRALPEVAQNAAKTFGVQPSSGPLFFPLHCKVPLVKGQAVTATLRNDTGQKIWLAAGVLGKLVREGTDESRVSLGLGVIEELAPGAVGRVSGEVTVECDHYLPLRLVVTWVRQ